MVGLLSFENHSIQDCSIVMLAVNGQTLKHTCTALNFIYCCMFVLLIDHVGCCILCSSCHFMFPKSYISFFLFLEFSVAVLTFIIRPVISHKVFFILFEIVLYLEAPPMVMKNLLTIYIIALIISLLIKQFV